jgi:D-3-phosphoglycerate dehydrogenase
MARILLTHTPRMLASYYGEKAAAGLEALGDVRYHFDDEPLCGERLIEVARGCSIVVSDRATPGQAGLFERSPELVAFVRCAVDIRTVDVAAASAAGVLVTQASPGFIDAVAELGIGMMVDLGRGMSAATLAYRAGEKPVVRMGTQLAGSTLGVIGYGAIGARLAELGLALGQRVLVSDPHVEVAVPGIEQVSLRALLEGSDFVVCLAVATEETENLIDAGALARMRSTAYFINLSRGDLVDEAALEAALSDKAIAGAAMDVGRAPDQMPTPSLAAGENVVATPHIGGLTPAAIAHQALETVAQVEAIVAGRIPSGAVNAEHASRLGRGSRRS